MGFFEKTPHRADAALGGLFLDDAGRFDDHGGLRNVVEIAVGAGGNAGDLIDDFDALTPAVEAGSSKAVNIVLMGRFAKYVDIPYERWIAAIEKAVKPKFVEMNKRAFELGYRS